jgi:DNA-binding transcriptional ArsR family regulator
MDSTILAALGEPTRFAIVQLLRDGGQPSVSEVAHALGIRQPQASKHLQVLREAGVVRAERDARRVVHRLRPEPFDELARWVESFGSLWETRLDALGAYLDRADLGPPAGPDRPTT